MRDPDEFRVARPTGRLIYAFRSSRFSRVSGLVRAAKMPSAPPQKKWGPALLPAPTAPSEGSAGVRNLVGRTRRTTDPLSILAHQLRRRFPPHNPLVRGALTST